MQKKCKKEGEQMKKKLSLIILLIGIWSVFATDINTFTLHSISNGSIVNQSEPNYPKP
jgi:hypothetical protein